MIARETGSSGNAYAFAAEQLQTLFDYQVAA